MIRQGVSNTAPKTIFSFSRRPEKMVFPKKLCWNMIFLYCRKRWYFILPKIWSYTLNWKWKMIFLKKYKKIWHFFPTVWNNGLSKKGCAGKWSFLYYLKRWYFFPRKHIFSLGRKWKAAFLRKYMEIWCTALHQRKTGNLLYRIDVWLLLKFIRLEIFYNE